MGETRITINGQHYGSPDEMPPQLRLQYEAAMKALHAATASGELGDTTQVFSGFGGNASVVIRTTTSHSSCQSFDQAPAGLRALAEGGKPEILAAAKPAKLAGSYVPIEPSTYDKKARDFLWGLIGWVVIGLVLWFFLGRW